MYEDQLITIGYFLFWFFLYFLPSIIAYQRKHLNYNSIFVINFFLGWTLLGWIGCLAWSVSGNVKPKTS